MHNQVEIKNAANEGVKQLVLFVKSAAVLYGFFIRPTLISNVLKRCFAVFSAIVDFVILCWACLYANMSFSDKK